MASFDFSDLFILDMANNHQGELNHGLSIIEACGKVVAETGCRTALKFQFRNLETFIHPAYRDRKDIPHVPRFLETALSREAFRTMTDAVRAAGMVTMATPFDEDSVDLAEELGIEVIKIASCSAADYPLLDRVAQSGKPVIVSSAGLSMKKIDRLVSFLQGHHVDFALMHCVAIYPTPRDRLNLNQITVLKQRFPNAPVGFSTHEDPDNLDAVRMAVAKGAKLFERHVGVADEKHKLNAYSSTPDQIRAWMLACRDAQAICGGDERAPAPAVETKSLQSLMRGVFAKSALSKGAPISRDSVFFAMPMQEKQLAVSDWRKGLSANRDYKTGEPLDEALADFTPSREDNLFQILLQVKGMLHEARIPVQPESPVELSHHYGLERFREFGCVLIDCVNRTYCKKLIIMLPRQKHPYHYHAKKEETFQLLQGDLEVFIEGRRRRLAPGDTLLVEPGQWHKFHTLDGCIFEEISTTHYNDDSFYDDEQIAKIPREQRKTPVSNWSWS